MAEEAEGRRFLSALARAGGWGPGLVLSPSLPVPERDAAGGVRIYCHEPCRFLGCVEKRLGAQDAAL